MTNPTQPPTVPEELRHKWLYYAPITSPEREYQLMAQAIAWAWAQRGEEVREAEQRGADAEYSACHTWLDINGCPSRFIDGLREARRPSPPTLREQALKALRERLDNPMVVHLPENRAAMELALQALKETPND
jgi:hypothetical protein